MLVFEAKLQGTKEQYQSLDNAIRTARFVRNACLRYWMDNRDISQLVMLPGHNLDNGLNISHVCLAWLLLQFHPTIQVKIALIVVRLSKNFSALELILVPIVDISRIGIIMLRGIYLRSDSVPWGTRER